MKFASIAIASLVSYWIFGSDATYQSESPVPSDPVLPASSVPYVIIIVGLVILIIIEKKKKRA